MLESFHGSCFEHGISKVFYNVIIEEKISWGLTPKNVLLGQKNLAKGGKHGVKHA
jgi:hypothetical protein